MLMEIVCNYVRNVKVYKYPITVRLAIFNISQCLRKHCFDIRHYRNIFIRIFGQHSSYRFRLRTVFEIQPHHFFETIIGEPNTEKAQIHTYFLHLPCIVFVVLFFQPISHYLLCSFL